MDEITTRIKKVRTDNDLTQEEMGLRLGAKRYQIADIESGKVQLSMKMLKSISEKFHIDVYWLMYGDNPPDKMAEVVMNNFGKIAQNMGVSSKRMFHGDIENKPSITKDIGNIRTKHKDAYVSREELPSASVKKMGYESPDGLQVTILKTEVETVALIPEISDKLAAGMGYYPQDHVLALGTRTFALEWIESKGLNPQKLRLLRIHGDSMTPAIQDKDMVMLNMGCPPSQAFPVAFRLNNELFIKNYQPQGDGSIHMLSRNKAYDPIIINPKQPPEDFEIIGCVVWHAHSYI